MTFISISYLSLIVVVNEVCIGREIKLTGPVIMEKIYTNLEGFRRNYVHCIVRTIPVYIS